MSSNNRISILCLNVTVIFTSVLLLVVFFPLPGANSKTLDFPVVPQINDACKAQKKIITFNYKDFSLNDNAKSFINETIIRGWKYSHASINIEGFAVDHSLISAEDIALKRAKAVSSFLENQGIESSYIWIKFKGLVDSIRPEVIDDRQAVSIESSSNVTECYRKGFEYIVNELQRKCDKTDEKFRGSCLEIKIWINKVFFYLN